MSIKLLALELYRAQQGVDRLQSELALLKSSGDTAAVSRQEEELRHARAELQLLRKMLDDKKSSSITPRSSSGFSF